MAWKCCKLVQWGVFDNGDDDDDDFYKLAGIKAGVRTEMQKAGDMAQC